MNIKNYPNLKSWKKGVVRHSTGKAVASLPISAALHEPSGFRPRQEERMDDITFRKLQVLSSAKSCQIKDYDKIRTLRVLGLPCKPTTKIAHHKGELFSW